MAVDKAKAIRSIARRRTRGQALVEFALLSPVLVMMVLGVIDLGRAFYTYEALANAAREGARYCSLHAHDSNLVSGANVSSSTIDRVTGELAGTVSNISVFGATTSDPACDTTVDDGSPVTVSVSTTFTPITPLIGSVLPGGSLTIEASVTMMMQSIS